MNIKMIVVDLDGTLLRTDKTISERTQATLRKCREAGIKVVYATARGGSAEHVAPAELFDGKITMSGAVAKIGNEVVFKCLIPHQIARPILVACAKRGLCITAETGKTYYTSFIVPGNAPIHKTDCRITNFKQYDVDAEKIYAMYTTVYDRTFVKNLLPKELQLTAFRDDGFCTISHIHATKSNAVSKLARLWNISPAETVAFGDDLVDIDLLTYAGAGIAMANALDEVKAAANIICLSNGEDGVAHWLENNVL